MDGGVLCAAAKVVTNTDVYSEYPTEDNLHYFEMMNGFGELRFLEALKFGEREYEVIKPIYEATSQYKINSDTVEFKNYQEELFDEAVNKITKNCHLNNDIKDLITSLSDLQNIENAQLTEAASPKEGWITIDEHIKLHAVDFADEEEIYRDRFKMPQSVDYRLSKGFAHLIDVGIDIVPDLTLVPESRSVASKVLNFINPNRDTARLQSELQGLSNNIGEFKKCSAEIDRVMSDMQQEIVQMKSTVSTAKEEIKEGKHFNEWLQLNMKHELKSLGLDPNKATMNDLMAALPQQESEIQSAQTKQIQANFVMEAD